jgi:hypothetical protein
MFVSIVQTSIGRRKKELTMQYFRRRRKKKRRMKKKMSRWSNSKSSLMG